MKLNNEVVKSRVKHPEKVLQFGEGNFLRAFVDWIIDKMNKEADFNGSVVAVQPIANGLVHLLNEQDGLYTLYLRGIKNNEAVSEHFLIESISRGINPYADYDEYMKTAENPELRFIISNTTEAGIAFNENDKLEDRPQNSFPGKLTALLYKRYTAFNGSADKGLIIIPCELIDRNGDNLKSIILKYAELWKLGEGFIRWINESNTFCNTLVDRIVPGYPKDRIAEIHKELGYEDNLVVEGEQFHLWVIEGPKWIQKEFPTDKVGLNVLFVDDMTPYRTRKVRILNGAHTTMVPVSYLYGLETVRETVEDEVMGEFVRDALYEEIVPTLDLPKEELEGFAADVLDRFRNPFIKHYLMSIALNSMSKFETRVLPSILEYIKRKNELPKKLVFSLAALMAFYKGDRNGEPIELNDNQDILELYKEAWSKVDGSEESYRNLVKTILGYKNNWKMDLNEVKGLTDLVTHYLMQIEKLGIKKALEEVL